MEANNLSDNSMVNKSFKCSNDERDLVQIIFMLNVHIFEKSLSDLNTSEKNKGLIFNRRVKQVRVIKL